MRQRLRLLVLVVVAMVALAGCGQSASPPPSSPAPAAQQPAASAPAPAPVPAPAKTAPAPAPKPPVKQEMIVRQLSWGLGMDPIVANEVYSYYHMFNVYSGLLTYKPGTTDYELDLAEKYDVSEGGKVYTFQLRKGVQFQKGYGELTAEDVKFSFDRHLDPKNKSVQRQALEDVIDKVEVVDPYTVRFRLKSPFAPFLRYLTNSLPNTGVIVSKKAVTEMGNDKFNQIGVGSGPFEMTQYVPRQQAVLKRFDKYFKGPARLETVIFKYMPDQNTTQIAIEKGELHHANLSQPTPEMLKRLQANPDLVVTTKTPPGLTWLNFNIQWGPLKDPKVRLALAHAIDKKGLADIVLGGAAIAGTNFIGPSVLGHAPYTTAYTYNPGKAKQLLAEAGYPKGFKAVFSGRNDGGTVPLNEPVVEMLRQVGIDIELKVLERGAYTSARRKGEMQFSLYSNSPPPDPDFLIRRFFHSENFPPGDNAAFYTGADSYLDRGRIEPDEKKRIAIYQDMEKQLQQDLPGVPLVHFMDTQAVRKNVKGLVHDPMRGIYLYPMYLE